MCAEADLDGMIGMVSSDTREQSSMEGLAQLCSIIMPGDTIFGGMQCDRA